MKKIITVILSLITLLVASATASAYDGKQVIVVRNTEKHGLYVTVGGTKIYCDKTLLWRLYIWIIKYKYLKIKE